MIKKRMERQRMDNDIRKEPESSLLSAKQIILELTSEERKQLLNMWKGR